MRYDAVESADRTDHRLETGDAPVIEAVNISKAFGATTALVDVSLKAHAGRILALLGDNGAGKSTLIKILSGVFPPDRGELRFRGEPVRFATPPRRAHAASPPVFQDLAVCELLSVTRNVVLGREPQKGFGPFKWLDIKRADEHGALGARTSSASAGSAASTSAASTSPAASASRWRSRGRCSSARRCLILDEPTSALAVRQAARCSTTSPRARDRGRGRSSITHNFRHALSVADDLAVLAQGRVEGRFLRSETDLEQLTELVANVG